MSDDNKNEFEQMLEASFQSLNQKFDKGQKIQAEIVSLGRDSVFVVCRGQEGAVDTKDLTAAYPGKTFQVGDVVDLYVVKKNDQLLQLTAKPSNKALSDSLEEAFDLELPVEGRVTEAVNGGYRVQILNKTAFCPFSQIELYKAKDPENYLNKKFTFIISKFEEGGRNIVVSRRRVLEMEKLEAEGDFLKNVKAGDVLEGRVSRLEAFGAFVELKTGIEGLVHISELGWSRVAHPSEVVSSGDPVKVKVLSVNEDDMGRLKISLSRKQVESDPWEEATKKLSLGQKVQGTIREKERFGILIELLPGVIGLLPQSEIREALAEKDLSQKKKGDSINVVVSRISLEDRRISLTLVGDGADEDWKDFSQKQSTGMGAFAAAFQKAEIKKK